MRLSGRPVTKRQDPRATSVRDHSDPSRRTPGTGPGHPPRLGARWRRPIVAAVAVVIAAWGPVTARLISAATSPSPATPAASSTSAGDDWSQLTPTTAPLPRDSAEVAYDTSTSTVVMSGGETACGPLGREVYQDTWTWDGKAWKEVATNAPPVFGVPAAYDGATQTFDVLWYPGCADGPTTSQWNGQSWGGGSGVASPSQLTQTAWPEVDGAMAYDASTQTILLWSPSPPFEQSTTSSATPTGSTTWSWDGTTWNELSPSISPPPSVGDSQDVQMVYDSATSQILLYGDHSQAMWAWNGSKWSELSGSGGPSPRVGSSMVYDSTLGEALLFGGNAVTAYTTASAGQPETYTLGAPLNDLWAWNGTAWQQLHPVTSPPARFYAQMAYDAASGQAVLFGGAVNDTADIADTWVYGPAS